MGDRKRSWVRKIDEYSFFKVELCERLGKERFKRRNCSLYDKGIS